MPPESIRVTRFSGDGGYDVICEVIDTRGTLFELRRLLLCEAKLRTIRTASIDADVFAKSVLIAYDNSADAIVLVTNCRFSETTLRRSRSRVKRRKGVVWTDRRFRVGAASFDSLIKLTTSRKASCAIVVDEARRPDSERDVITLCRSGKGSDSDCRRQRFIQETDGTAKRLRTVWWSRSPIRLAGANEDLVGSDAEKLRIDPNTHPVARNCADTPRRVEAVVVDHVAAALARQRRLFALTLSRRSPTTAAFFFVLLSASCVNLRDLTAGERRENLVAACDWARVYRRKCGAVAMLRSRPRQLYCAGDVTVKRSSTICFFWSATDRHMSLREPRPDDAGAEDLAL